MYIHPIFFRREGFLCEFYMYDNPACMVYCILNLIWPCGISHTRFWGEEEKKEIEIDLPNVLV